MSTTKQGTKTTVPRLRFPEFRNALPWNAKLLKDICAVNPSNDGLPDSFVYIDLESVEDGQLKAKNRIEKSDAPSRAQRHLRNGDVIFQVVRPYQRNNLYVDFDDGQQYVASTGYAQLRAKDSERFLYQAVHVDSFVEGVIAKCTGSNYPAINSSDLAEIQVFVPHDAAEQQKIADCLTSLDEVIAAQGRKVEALKAHKRGLMQQLFPREGETRPRLRFPEFRGAPEWDATSVGAWSKSFSGGTPPTTRADYYGGEIPFIRSAEIGSAKTELSLTQTGLKASSAKLVDAGDVLLALYGANSGDVALARTPGAINQAILCIRPNGSKAFLYHYLTAIQPWLVATFLQGGQGNLSGEIVKSVGIRVPSSEEQQRIADCLSSLDTRISAETARLAALKTHKQGLMQQLFPAPEAAQA